MVTNWTLVASDYSGDTSASKKKYLKFNATIDGCNIVGKSIYVYYYYKNYDKRGNVSYSTPRLATNQTAPFDLEIIYPTEYKQYMSGILVLFSNKQMDVSTITTDVPRKFWYEFNKPNSSSFTGKNPARYVYEPRRFYKNL